MTIRLLTIFLLLSVALGAQAPPTDRQVLEQALPLAEQLYNLLRNQLSPPTPPPPTEQSINVECGEALQPYISDARASNLHTTLRLEWPCDGGFKYAGTLTVGPNLESKNLVITTQGWEHKGPDLAGRVVEADRADMATIIGSVGNPNAINIQSGPVGAGFVGLIGVDLQCAHVNCTMLRIGDRTNGIVANTPQQVVVTQVSFQGNLTYGTLRGVYAGGRDITVTQSLFTEIWMPNTDNQCLSTDNGGIDVIVTWNYMACGSENLIVGGAPTLSAEMHPRNWYVAYNEFHKPIRWQTDGTHRQVKNNLEFKYVENVVVEFNNMINNWAQGQDGTALLITMATNGACAWCGGLTDVVVRGNVIMGALAGISISGYSYWSNSATAARVERVLIEHNYVETSTGRPLKIENVRVRHDITIRRNTLRNANNTQWLSMAYGNAWTVDPLLASPGGPMDGLYIVDNVVRRNGVYGITAPNGSHFGSGFGTFVASDRQLSGNVIGDGGPPASGSTSMTATLNNYNLHVGSGTPNIRVPQVDMDTMFPAGVCSTYTLDPTKGADCALLAPVFARLATYPEA